MRLIQRRRTLSREDIPETRESIQAAIDATEAERAAARAEGVPEHIAPPLVERVTQVHG